MFCGNCGAQCEDGAAFCKKCGQQIGNTGGTTLQEGKKKSGHQIVWIVIAALVILASLVLSVKVIDSMFFKKNGYEAVIDKMFQSLFFADGEELLEVVPEELLISFADEMGYDKNDMTDLVDELEDAIRDEYGDMYETYQSKLKIKCKCGKATPLTESELEQIQEDYMELWISIDEAKRVPVNIDISADGFTNSMMVDVVVIKVDKKWYIDIFSLEDFF